MEQLALKVDFIVTFDILVPYPSKDMSMYIYMDVLPLSNLRALPGVVVIQVLVPLLPVIILIYLQTCSGTKQSPNPPKIFI